ncbi:MAG: CopG family transcriptional regulator [Acidobacteria bacterium]|nr:CopG family transcriptional regulator [Acidobacteriota bacterium]
MKKRLPKFKTDKDVETFLEKDLSDYITEENLSRFTFEFEPKEKVVNLRMSKSLFERVKEAAEERHMPYQRYIRQALENAVKN